jgi:sugar porter (SP) family MFS transporter
MDKNLITNKQHKSLTFWMIVLSGIGGVLYGYDVGVFSGAMPFIVKELFVGVDKQTIAREIGIIGGAVFGGGLFGTLITGYLSDKFGRRNIIITSCVIFIIAIEIVINAQSFTALLVGRLLLGIGVGIVAVVVPLYLAEVAPAHIRGKSVTVFQLFLTIGILLAYVVDLFFTPTGDWRAMFTVIIIPAAILLLSMIVLPQSPRWLVSKLRYRKALKILHRIRSAEDAEKELLEIKQHIEQHQQQQSYGSWSELFSRDLLKPLFLAVFVAIFNQLTAINGFLQYAPAVFKAAGFQSNAGAMMGTIGLGSINFVFTAIALLLIDKLGRRRLILFGTAVIVIAYLLLGSLHWFNASLTTNTMGLLSLIGLLTMVAGFAIGPGVVVWLAISELFPTEVRGKGMSIGLFASSLAAWLVTSLFLQIQTAIGLNGSYWLFAACTAVYFIVVWKMLPETNQKSLEQVQDELETN